MSKVQIFASNVKTAVAQAREKFFNAKRDEFEYKAALTSRMVPLARVAVSRERIGSTNATRFEYGGRA